MADCEGQLLRAIANKHCKRRDVARAYRLALNSSDDEKVDWEKVHNAIVARWSYFAVEWISRQARLGNLEPGSNGGVNG